MRRSPQLARSGASSPRRRRDDERTGMSTYRKSHRPRNGAGLQVAFTLLPIVVFVVVALLGVVVLALLG